MGWRAEDGTECINQGLLHYAMRSICILSFMNFWLGAFGFEAPWKEKGNFIWANWLISRFHPVQSPWKTLLNEVHRLISGTQIYEAIPRIQATTSLLRMLTGTFRNRTSEDVVW
jgi:hypothetical protein